MATSVCSVKIRIARPLTATWDEVGPRLRELSWVAHRVLNGTIRRLELAAEVPEMVPAAWKTRVCVGSVSRPGGRPDAYPMARDALDAANAWRAKTKPCRWCFGTGVEPAEPPKKLKRRRGQESRAAGSACSSCDGDGAFAGKPPVDLPSAIHGGMARVAFDRFRIDRADVMRGKKSLSSWRDPAPIPITSSKNVETGEGAWALRHDGRGYVVDVPLYDGGKSGRRSFALAPDGKNAWAHLQRMVLPSAKLGDCKILAPKDGKKAWLAVLSYSVNVAEPEPRSGTAARLSLLPDGTPAVFVDGRKPRKVYEGESIAHKRRMFAARRSSRSKHQRDIGAGARGHGRARALEHYHAVDDAEARWRKSICQEIAAKAVREADLRGCSWVDIDESIAKVLPPAEMRGAVDWALERAGFAPPNKTSPGATPTGGASS